MMPRSEIGGGYMSKKIILWVGLLTLPLNALAGGFSIGGQFWSYSDSFRNSGNEFYMPVSISVDPANDFSLYLQTELGVATFTYSPSVPGGNSYTYVNLSDSMLGAQFKLELGAVQPFVNVGLNLPTGDYPLGDAQDWLSAHFVDARYLVGHFGISALAGVEILDHSTGYFLRVGYMGPGVFNQTFGLPQDNVNNSLYDIATFIFSAARSESLGSGQSQEFGFWFLGYDSSKIYGYALYQLGPSFDFYYRLKNPQGFSLDSGVQLFQNSQSGSLTLETSGNTIVQAFYTPLATEPHNSRGPRFYLNPSLAIQDVTLAFQVTRVFPNDYPPIDLYYHGEGWLLGLGPVWRIKTGEKSAFKLSADYQKIILQNSSVDINRNLTDLLYDVFQFGAGYEVDF